MSEYEKQFEATEQMFALVGRTITRWSFVESVLANIFAICTSPVCVSSEGGIQYFDSQVPSHIFFSVESFRGKLGLADAAVTSRLMVSGLSENPIFADWNRLKEKARKLSQKRNKLAHWTVLPAFSDGDEIETARLVPAYGSPGYYAETGWRSTSATLRPIHIGHLHDAFCILEEKLKQFAVDLAQREEPFDRAARLLTHQIASLDRQDPSRSERIRQAVSSK
jgi:hypothetical protein